MDAEELKERLRQAFESGRDSIFVDLDKIYEWNPKYNVIWHEHEFEDFYKENYLTDNQNERTINNRI